MGSMDAGVGQFPEGDRYYVVGERRERGGIAGHKTAGQ